MNRVTFTRSSTRALAVGAALLLTAGTAAVAVASGEDGTRPARAAEAKPREAAALTGSAKLFRKTTEDVAFTFDAHLAKRHNADPTKATGTFRFVHLDRPGGKGGWAEGRIDCLLTGGKVASATGIITRTNIGRMKGSRVGFSVHDQGRNDRLGYSWAATGGPDGTKKLTKCTSAAPFEKVRQGTGDFHVTPWKVPYPTS
ncbi:Repetin [Streptomyces longispororuber]|uniref:Repetin n=1 Tax=Streptomyces longispororuber TaxID=68230 RepID=UPI0033E5B4AD